MDKPVTITLLANAGLLFQYDGHALLLDALQKSENVPFSPLPNVIWQEMLCNGDRFSQVAAILFTHLHSDHFSADITLQYLKHRPVPWILLPEDPSVPGIDAIREEAGERLILLPSGPHSVTFQLSPEISVQAFTTRHLDKQFYDVPHFCYLLSFGAKNILITADIDYTFETLSLLDGIPLCAAFVNPLFFSALRAGRFFKGQLKTDRICVYHIPFEPDDQLNIRALVHKELSLWQGNSQITAFERPLQTLDL